MKVKTKRNVPNKLTDLFRRLIFGPHRGELVFWSRDKYCWKLRSDFGKLGGYFLVVSHYGEKESISTLRLPFSTRPKINISILLAVAHTFSLN